MSRGRAILIAVDQLLAAIIIGYPDPTLSAVAWVWEQTGKRAWPRKAIDTVFFWEPHHCYKSWGSELLQKHYPADFFDPKLFIPE